MGIPDGAHTHGGGAWWPLPVAIGLVALFYKVIGSVIHVIALIITFTAIAAAAVAVGYLSWWLHGRTRRQVPVQYQPQMTQPRWRPGLPQDPPQAIGQQPGAVPQVHNHYGISLQELEEFFQRRGGRS